MIKSLAEAMCIIRYTQGWSEAAATFDEGATLIKDDKKYTFYYDKGEWEVEDLDREELRKQSREFNRSLKKLWGIKDPMDELLEEIKKLKDILEEI